MTQPPGSEHAHYVADEINLRELLATIWDGKWLIAACAFVFGALAVTYAVLTKPVYRAEATVLIKRESSSGGGGLGSLPAQFGSMADLAGFSLGDNSDRNVVLATLQSRVLIDKFIAEKDLLKTFFSAKWDEESKRWRVDDPAEIPTAWDGHKFFKSLLKVSETKKTGLVTVAIEWTDPDEAAGWVTELIANTNANLRSADISDSEKRLAYLEQQTSKISVLEVRKSIYNLMEAELKRLMIAQGDAEYALKTIDPAVPPQDKIRPKRALIAAMGLLLGLFSGVVLVFVRRSYRDGGPLR